MTNYKIINFIASVVFGISLSWNLAIAAAPPIITGINHTNTVPGDQIEIYGTDLGNNVGLGASGGKITNIKGSIDSLLTVVMFEVPLDLSPGSYSVSVTSAGGIATTNQTLTVKVGGQTFQQSSAVTPPTQGLPTDLGQLIQQIFTWSLGILGISVFVMFFYSGFLWLTAAGNTSRIGEARTHMTNAVFGAILLLSSYLILYTINPDFVKNTVNLPGLGKTSSDTSNTGSGEETVGELPLQGQPIPTASLLSDLKTERAKYGETVTHEEAGKILNAVAWKNSAAGWGLLSKSPPGNNCPLNGAGQSISCDWLVYKPSLLGLDVLIGGPGTRSDGTLESGPSTPTWGDGYPVKSNKWVAPVAP